MVNATNPPIAITVLTPQIVQMIVASPPTMVSATNPPIAIGAPIRPIAQPLKTAPQTVADVAAD